MSDRTVHARLHDLEIVRYDRAGKWYAERPGSRRVRLNLAAAVQSARAAIASGGEVFLDLPGGKSFDSKYRAAAVVIPEESK